MRKSMICLLLAVPIMISPFDGVSFQNDPPGTRYSSLPFNPADDVKIGTVVRISLANRFRSGVGRNIAVLAYKKSSNKLHLAQEIWGPATRDYHEEATYDLTTGKISSETFIRDQFGIELPSGTAISIEKEKYCDCDMRNDGTVKVINFHGGSDCIRISFLVRGDKVPFCGDSSLMVSANIFLNRDVPITGVRNARFFFLEKYDGKWVRTHPTEYVGMRLIGSRERMSMPFEDYYRSSNWTKLFKYMQSSGTDSKPASFRTGDRVLAKVSGYFYPGVLRSISGNRASVGLLSGSNTEIGNITSELRSFTWSSGADIICKQPWDNEWTRCGVRSMEGEYLRVLFSGADVATRVHMGQCRAETAGGSVPVVDGEKEPEKEPQRPDPGTASPFGTLLIDFETSVLPDYKLSRWRERRAGWLSDVKSSSGLGDYKRLLLEFEAGILSSGQNKSWLSNSRSKWLSGVRGSGSLQDLAGYMKECETNVIWKAQTPSWKENRKNWLNKVNSIR